MDNAGGNEPGSEAVGALLTAALNNQLDKVRELAADSRWLDDGPPEVWAVLGAAPQLRGLLAHDMEAAKRKYGTRERELLLYVCFSHCHKLGPEYAQGLLESARLLLAAGADPNAAYDAGPPWEGAMQTALYGATGHANHPALARMLLEAGADPNDDESLYHSAEHMYRECLGMLLAFGADVSRRSPHWKNTPLYFLASYKERDANVATANEGFAWLLDHGADPNVLCEDAEETALHAVARLNRNVELARQLVEHGAGVSFKRADGRTPYALAVMFGNTTVADYLKQHGATDDELSIADRMLGAASRGHSAAARKLAEEHPEVLDRLTDAERSVLPEAADEGRVDAVKALLALGIDPGATGRFGATSLHLAAFRGDTAMAAAILEHNPPLETQDPDFHATPLGWCDWASTNNPAPGGDYPATARLLVTAGASTDIPLIGTPEVQAAIKGQTA